MQDDGPTFAAVLQHYRVHAGLTQEELAERAHLSTRGISDLERGVRQLPRPDTVRRLAAALQLGGEERTAFEQAARPPTALPTAARPHLRQHRSLPTPPTPLLGRAQDLAALWALLVDDAQRLVTVVGPPGVGKTRVALQTAMDVGDAFRDGVCFVPLAAVTNPTQVLSAMMAALDLQELGGQTQFDTLTAYLHHKHLLLILDNFEHVLPAASTLASLLQQAPQLTMLVTSRTPVHLVHEQYYHLSPLDLPPHHDTSAATAMTYSAIALFAHRARAVQPTFVLTDTNAPTIAAICRRLDGLPLAIELAAARSNVLTPPALLRHLDARLDLLRLPRADVPERHHTLRQAIAWSYALLGPEVQALLRRLSVFMGGATLAAVHVVCTLDEEEVRVANGAATDHTLPAPTLLDHLETLMQHHLLQQTSGFDQEPRFTMLETIRTFAAEQLDADGDEATRTRQRHLAYYVSVAEAADAALQHEDQQPWFDLLDAEHANIRAALQWRDPSNTNAERRVRLATAAATFWLQRGHLREGRAWMADVLASAGNLPLTLHARAQAQASQLARAQTDLAEARALADASLALARSSGDQQSEAVALYTLGFVAYLQAQHQQARAYLEASVALASVLGDTRQYTAGIDALGNLACYQGHDAEAQALFEQEVVLCRTSHDTVGLARALVSLGVLWCDRKEYQAAGALLREGLARAQACGNKRYTYLALNNLGELARMQGHDQQAAHYYQAALTICQEQGNRIGGAGVLGNCGFIAVRQGNAPHAAACFAQSLGIYHAIQDTHDSALVVVGCAGVAWMVAQPARAARLLGAADAMLTSIGAVMDAADQIEYERSMAASRAQLSPAAFDAAYTHGQTLTTDLAVEEALFFAHAVEAGLIGQSSARDARSVET